MIFNRRELMMGGAATVAAVSARTQSPVVEASGPERTYRDSLVIDAQGALHSFDPANGEGKPVLPRFLAEGVASGVTAVSLTVGPVGDSDRAFEQSVEGIAYFQREIDANPRHLIKIRSHEDLLTAKRTNRLGLIFNFQDSTMIGKELKRIGTFKDLGVRIIQLTYNRRNLAGSGCLEAVDGGLTPLGRELVSELNGNHILVDASHAGPKTQSDAISVSARPIAITHSGCRALVDRPRNTPDEVLRKLADRGGVFGLYLMPFLRLQGQPTAQDLIAHIEHALKVAGEDHVGIGSDGGIPAITAMDAYKKHLVEVDEYRRKAGFAAPGESPDVMLIIPEYNHPRRLERLAEDLSARGHPSRRIEKILGGNFARLFREAWS